MATQNRIAVAKSVESLDREEAFVGENDVERDTSMTLAQNHPISTKPSGLARSKAQDVIVKNPQHFDQRHSRADVTPFTLIERANREPAQISRSLVEGGTARLQTAQHRGHPDLLQAFKFINMARAAPNCRSLASVQPSLAPARTRLRHR